MSELEIYEVLKQQLKAKNLKPQEYEECIREIAKWLAI